MTREVHGVTGKHKSNVELHAAGGWCGCCFQGGIGIRAFNKCLPFDFRVKLSEVKGADNTQVLNYTNLYA